MTETTREDTGALTGAQARARFRTGERTTTIGWADRYAQANLISVPRAAAYDLLLFAQRNPQACPLLDVSEPGGHTTVLAEGADLRTDLPSYYVWRNGELADEVRDATPYWREDLVTFLIGCSLTFERALMEAGVPVRHIEEGVTDPMFTTARRCRPAGRISGPLVVSMRPLPPHLVSTAVRITARYPNVHGAPVHVGDPAALGIADVRRPDFGDAVTVGGDVPAFWACGVTTQAAVVASKLDFAISHVPGYMFITDVPDSAYAL
ncbi:putative hydro-lyase [Nocardiopsis sediminis]|uniref:Putative hydro-lyase ACFOVU_17170 n=1 Tax=Nocardiopsis sediminis TaxID=1778267 RepID=A0ABV8FSG3_9ACTN